MEQFSGLGPILIIIGVLLIIAVGVVVLLVVLGNNRAKREAALHTQGEYQNQAFAAAGLPGQQQFQQQVPEAPLPQSEQPAEQIFAQLQQDPASYQDYVDPAVQQLGFQQDFGSADQGYGVAGQTYPAQQDFFQQDQYQPNAAATVDEQISAEYERLASEPTPQRWGSLQEEAPQPFAWPDGSQQPYTEQPYAEQPSENLQLSEYGNGNQAAEFSEVQQVPVVEPVAEYAPEPAAPVAPAAPEPVVETAATSDEDDDHTVVVQRVIPFALELPDGTVFELPGSDVIVGRKPQAQPGTTVLALNDMTRTLSKSHVRMRRIGDSWTVEDLHSTNGVSVDAGDGTFTLVEPGTEVAATPKMVFGTLEVTLREL